MKEQIALMLSLQDQMNAKVNPEWRLQGFEWYRAIWVECAEMLDHYGWKWWKAQSPDMPQVELELVDIWHFGLSDLLQQEGRGGDLVETLERELNTPCEAGDVRLAIETFAANTLQNKAFDLKGFVSLMSAVDLSFSDLFARYVAKNVLNFFRQDHGYKEGTYIKVWHGREDNEHLMDVLDELHGAELTQERLYSELEKRYPS
jgi:dimeric dUTPase (all-alpha-NTP-PPase superfamily)